MGASSAHYVDHHHNPDTLTGHGNTVDFTPHGNHAENRVTGRGSDNHVVQAGHDSARIHGSHNHAQQRGRGDALSISGEDDEVRQSSRLDLAALVGGHDSVRESGARDHVREVGSRDRVNVRGSGDQVTVQGSHDTVSLHGKNIHLDVAMSGVEVHQDAHGTLVASDAHGNPIDVVRNADGRYRLDTLTPAKGSWDQIHQNQVGDCYFISSLVDQARSNPQSVRDLIHANPDGTYTVSFHGRAPVTVDGRGVKNGATGGGHWVGILEQAWETSQGLMQPDGTAKDPGGYPRDAIYALSGNAETSRYTEPYGTDAAQNLAADSGEFYDIGWDLAHGDSVVAASNSGTGEINGDGVVNDHAYSVLGVDAQGDVELRNPWGDTPATAAEPNGHQPGADGTFWLSEQQFVQDFPWVTEADA